jgi:hypothetical protein
MIDPMQDPMRPTSYVAETGREHPAEQVLRKLASWIGVGGYNAEAVDAHVFHQKIVWGIRNLMQDKHAGLAQCGWADEFGNVFPMGAWKPQSKTWRDADKAEWIPVYKASAEPERAMFTLNEIAECAAKADVARLDFQALLRELETIKPSVPKPTKTPLQYRATPLFNRGGYWHVESELGNPVCDVADEATARLFADALNKREQEFTC